MQHKDLRFLVLHLSSRMTLCFANKSFFIIIIEISVNAFSNHFSKECFYYSHLFLFLLFCECMYFYPLYSLNVNLVFQILQNFFYLRILTFWTILRMCFYYFCLSFYLFKFLLILLFQFIPSKIPFVLGCLCFLIFFLRLLNWMIVEFLCLELQTIVFN
jgi:hypothetical protein